jgi:hypothetical protein
MTEYLLLKNASAELRSSAEAFAKGGDSEEHLEVSLFRLHIHNIVCRGFKPSQNVTDN